MSKRLGQVITPDFVIEKMLAELTKEEFLTKKILEPACGDGAFLVKIVECIVAFGRDEGLADDEIVSILENNLYGIEIDHYYYEKCLFNLNNKIETLGLSRVRWNVVCEDTLDYIEKVEYYNYFDIVIGNPPYIRIHNLEEGVRKKIREHFEFSKKGNIDIYLSFFEIALKLCAKEGKVLFITPNSYFKSQSSYRFRASLIANRYLLKLYDYSGFQVFKGNTTYTTITILQKGNKKDTFDYYKHDGERFNHIGTFAFELFNGRKFIFNNHEDEQFLKRVTDRESNLRKHFDIQYGIATLRDKIFISDNVSEIDSEFVLFNGRKVERSILRSIVKASTYRGENRYSWIIFPYRVLNGAVVSISEERLKEEFPFAYDYLLGHQEELLKRDLTPSTKWYEFGRSQGLRNAFKPKIVIQPLVKDQVHAHIVDKEVLVYSGIFITPKDDTPLTICQEILSSSDFLRYVWLIGKDYSGGYKAINTKNIGLYRL